jgi:hypothetical protein
MPRLIPQSSVSSTIRDIRWKQYVGAFASLHREYVNSSKLLHRALSFYFVVKLGRNILLLVYYMTNK